MPFSPQNSMFIFERTHRKAHIFFPANFIRFIQKTAKCSLPYLLEEPNDEFDDVQSDVNNLWADINKRV